MKADSSPTGRRKRSGRTRTSPTSFSARRYRPEIAKDKQVLLEVEAVNTFRGPAHILRGVTLEVGDGEVVSLVGRNGAGRTTIIESITGLLPVRSGRIRFRGEDITRLPPHKRAKRGIGYAPENSGIFPELTVAENLMISRWLSDKTARGAATGVDAQAQALTVFRDAVMMIKGLGISLLLAESNLTSAAAIADRLYVIDRGEIIFQGTPQEALANDAVMRTLHG